MESDCVGQKNKLETIIFEVIAVFLGGLEPILSEVFSNVICDAFVLNVIGLRFFVYAGCAVQFLSQVFSLILRYGFAMVCWRCVSWAVPQDMQEYIVW